MIGVISPKFLVLLVATTLLPVPALASYELMSIPSTSGLVRRIDPLSGTQLGNFGGSLLAPRFVETILSRGEAIMGTSDRLYRFDYSTGERRQMLAVLPIRDLTYDAARDTLLVLAGTTISRYQASDLRLLNEFTATDVGLDGGASISVTPDGRLMVASAKQTGSSYTVQYSTQSAVDGSSIRVVGSNSFTGVLEANGLGKIGFSRSNDGGWRYFGVSRTTGGIFSGSQIGFNSLGNPNLVGGWSVGAGWDSAASRNISIVTGHLGMYAVGMNGSGQTLVRAFDTNLFPTAIDERAYPFATPGGNFSVANVVAPEPGTFLALGAGLAWMVRRRRRA